MAAAKIILLVVFGSFFRCISTQSTLISPSIQQYSCHNTDYIKIFVEKAAFYENHFNLLKERVETSEKENAELKAIVEVLKIKLNQNEETTAAPVNPCNSNPCANGGRTSYTCSCDSGWRGTHCDQDIDECASSPCQNGGVCTNRADKYTCACVPGWTGINCDQGTTESSCIACSSTNIAFGADCTTVALEGWVVGEMDTYGEADLGTQNCTKGCYLRLQGGVTTRGCVESLTGDATLTGVLPSYIADGATICYPTADKICFCQGDDCSSRALDSNDGDPSMAGRDLTDTSMSVCDCGSCRKECSTSPSSAQCDCSASCGCVYN